MNASPSIITGTERQPSRVLDYGTWPKWLQNTAKFMGIFAISATVGVGLAAGGEHALNQAPFADIEQSTPDTPNR